MKRLLALPLAAMALAACAEEPTIGTGARTPAPPVLAGVVEETPAPSPAQTTSPSPVPSPTATPTAAPTAVPAPQTSLEEWAAAMPGEGPTYTIATGQAKLQDFVAWPEQPVTLRILSWKGTLEEAAAAYGVPLETLLAMNPDPESSDNTSDGSTIYYNLKLQDDYLVPKPTMKYVTISTPWVANSIERTDSYMVPAALSDQAAACMATAYDFQFEHYGMQGGIWPADYDEETGWYCTTEGGLCTTYSDLTRYLENVYTAERCEELLGGPAENASPDQWKPYYQGENDTILFQGGDRGSYIAYCGKTFTEPELQPDGSLQFWQLSLSVESDGFVGWGEGITYTPDTASATIVRLEPTETGWRVADLSLPD